MNLSKFNLDSRALLLSTGIFEKATTATAGKIATQKGSVLGLKLERLLLLSVSIRFVRKTRKEIKPILKKNRSGYSPLLSLFLSLTILDRFGYKKGCSCRAFFYFIFINTKRKKGKNLYKKYLHNGSFLMNIHRLCNLVNKFFRLFNLVYRLFSRTFLFASTILFLTWHCQY